MSSPVFSQGSLRTSALLAVLALTLGIGMSGAADDNADKKASRTQSADKKNQDDKSAGSEAPIKGGVEQVEISLSRIRDVNLGVQRLKSDVKSLYEESTRQYVTIESSPSIIGTSVVNIPYRFQTGRYMPPRRKWVNNYLAQIGPDLRLLKEGVDETESGCRELLVPEGVKDDLQNIFSDWAKMVKEANHHFDDLEEYVSKSKLTNDELGSKALVLGNDMRGLEVTLKAAFKLVKTSQKKNKNDKLVPIS